MKISKYFTRSEVACKCGCGFNVLDAVTARLADEAREFVGHPITPSSAARCHQHAYCVGGSENSMHLLGKAIDLPVHRPKALYEYLCEKYPDRHGFGCYDTFVHIDSRVSKARWKR